jgi:hypothetical protein
MGSQFTQTAVSPGSTPYAATFPSASIAVDAGGGTYSYYTTTSSDITLIGFATTVLQYPYTNGEKFFTYPFTYNSSFSDSYNASWILNTIPTTRTGSITVTGDAYGTLKLPSGTISNTLRVKIVQNNTDVSDFGGGFTITTTFTSTTYDWFVPGNKNVLMGISYINTDIGGFSSYAKSVNYYPAVVSTEDIQPVVYEFHLFPNPTKTNASISFSLQENGDVKFSIINISGQVMKSWEENSLTTGEHSVEMNTVDLMNGVYFIRLEMLNRKPVTLSFVKE